MMIFLALSVSIHGKMYDVGIFFDLPFITFKKTPFTRRRVDSQIFEQQQKNDAGG